MIIIVGSLKAIYTENVPKFYFYLVRLRIISGSSNWHLLFSNYPTNSVVTFIRILYKYLGLTDRASRDKARTRT